MASQSNTTTSSGLTWQQRVDALLAEEPASARCLGALCVSVLCVLCVCCLGFGVGMTLAGEVVGQTTDTPLHRAAAFFEQVEQQGTR